MAFAATLLLLVQASVGIAVNLYLRIPTRHLGDHSRRPSSRRPRVARSRARLVVIAIAIDALRLRRRATVVWSSIAASLVIGAGFNGG
ncbi:MAG: hypothetical protein JO262_20195 [Solirubrobacterales bacterium]|nr:hypothetical protein [Solirubrobacterales bacterium]